MPQWHSSPLLFRGSLPNIFSLFTLAPEYNSSPWQCQAPRHQQNESVLSCCLKQRNNHSYCWRLSILSVPLFSNPGPVTLSWLSCCRAKRGNWIGSKQWSWDTTYSKHTSSRYRCGPYGVYAFIFIWNPSLAGISWCSLSLDLCTVTMVHQRISRGMWKATLTAYAPQIRWFLHMCVCVFTHAFMHRRACRVWARRQACHPVSFRLCG